MIYKLIVNAAFLAIGYYIGKEVSRGELLRGEPKDTPKSTTDVAGKEPPVNTSKESGG